MAQKRMFTLSILDSDAFLEMPFSAQALYLHLNMRADDDGFVKNPKRIVRLIGAHEDDLRLLLLKKFVLCFESGVIVIKHWRMHNTIQKDRYTKTVYQEEISQLSVKANRSYTFTKNSEIPMVTTECFQNVYGMETECIQNDNTGLGLGLDIDYITSFLDEPKIDCDCPEIIDGECDGIDDHTKPETPPSRKKNTRAGKQPSPEVIQVLTYLNEKTGRQYKSTTAGHVRLIQARLSGGHTVDDCIKVIDVKHAEWAGKILKDGTNMEKFLRPSTLFAESNFDEYLNQAVDIDISGLEKRRHGEEMRKYMGQR